MATLIAQANGIPWILIGVAAGAVMVVVPVLIKVIRR